MAVAIKVIQPGDHGSSVQLAESVVHTVEGILEGHPEEVLHPVGGETMVNTRVGEHLLTLGLRPGREDRDDGLAQEDGRRNGRHHLYIRFHQQGENRHCDCIQLIHYRGNALQKQGIGHNLVVEAEGRDVRVEPYFIQKVR